MKIFNPNEARLEELRKYDRFALLYNNHTDNAHTIADLHDMLSEYERGEPMKINGDVYIPFTRRKK